MSNAPSEFAVGIDIGATSTRTGLVDSSGVILDRVIRPTDRNASATDLVSWLARDVTTLCERARVNPGGRIRVGLALPGTLDHDRTTVARSVAIPALQRVRIVDDLSTRAGVDVELFTDAEAATWGEYSLWTPRVRRFVHLRLGTGIACGVVLDGALQRLDERRTTHLESLVVDHRADALPCVCGLRGCLELFASGSALLRQAAHLGLGDDLHDLDRATAHRDEQSSKLVERAAQAVAVALENLTRQFRPDVIVIGGGVMSHVSVLRDATLRDGERSASMASIKYARLGDDAGVIGAARLTRD